MSRVFCIAEAASSHDGDIAKAYRLIEVAKAAGADAVKFQTFKAETLAAQRHAPDHLPIYQRYEMPLHWLPNLAEACDAVGIEFMTTVYHEDYLPLVDPYVRRWKVSSFEAQDRAFLQAHVSYGKPMIVSTGMMPRERIRAIALCPVVEAVLHCTSSYPTPLDQASIAAIRDLPLPVGVRRGHSDHSRCELAGAFAVAAGAQAVEVHFCLPETEADNPDRVVSHEPEALKRYIDHLRLAETMMGTGEKRPMACEEEMSKFVVNALSGDPRQDQRYQTVAFSSGRRVTALRLRPATLDDAKTLLDWRNDLETRAQSLRSDAVTPDEHALWLAAALVDPDLRLYVAECEGEPVGTGRLDFLALFKAGTERLERTPAARLSITIAPARRGVGHGSTLVHALVAEAIALNRAVATALIKATNARSLSAFVGAGFVPDLVAYGVVHLTRRLG